MSLLEVKMSLSYTQKQYYFGIVYESVPLKVQCDFYITCYYLFKLIFINDRALIMTVIKTGFLKIWRYSTDNCQMISLSK